MSFISSGGPRPHHESLQVPGRSSATPRTARQTAQIKSRTGPPLAHPIARRCCYTPQGPLVSKTNPKTAMPPCPQLLLCRILMLGPGGTSVRHHDPLVQAPDLLV